MKIMIKNCEKLLFLCLETPKQLPIEPEKTPAPSKSGDFQHFSAAAVTRPGWFPSYISVFVMVILTFLSRHNF